MIGGSMFSGIGGFDLAMRHCGVRIAWQAEIDPFCRRTLERRLPGVRRIHDVREIDENCGPIDLLCAGWPCQDLSVAGLRAGLAGERSGLFREVVRVLELLAPQWFLLENVPGLYSSYTPIDEPPFPLAVGDYGPAEPWDVEEDSDFEEVLTSLTELGYGLAWRCLDARYFDLAQRRERVLIVGCRGDVGRAAAVLFEPGSSERHPAARQEVASRDSAASPAASAHCAGTLGAANGRNRGLGNANELDGLVAATLDSGGHDGGFRTEPGEHLVAHPVLAKGNSSHAEDLETYVAHAVSKQTRLDGPVETLVAQTITATSHKTTDRAGSHGTGPVNLVAHTLSAEGCDASEDGTGGGTPIVLVVDEHNRSSAEHDIAQTLNAGRAGNRMGAIAWDRAQITSPDNRSIPNGRTAPTLAKTSQSMYGVRRLMPVECERLQGFPDGWTCLWDHLQPCDCADTPRYQAIGNAVAVNVVDWVLGRILVADALVEAAA